MAAQGNFNLQKVYKTLNKSQHKSTLLKWTIYVEENISWNLFYSIIHFVDILRVCSTLDCNMESGSFFEGKRKKNEAWRIIVIKFEDVSGTQSRKCFNFSFLKGFDVHLWSGCFPVPFKSIHKKKLWKQLSKDNRSKNYCWPHMLKRSFPNGYSLE